MVKKNNIKPNFDEKKIADLIFRITKRKEYTDKFLVAQIEEDNAGYDKFILSDAGDKILIKATSGVAACAAFGYYLKNCCGCFFGPLTEQMDLPLKAPAVGRVIDRETKFLYRYFMNYCTYSYTLLFAKWEEYERLTDWLLLSGVNLVLNIVGHEAVWRDVLKELDYSREEIDDFICGPAYLPWQWMGNMTKFGGDLTDNWYDKQIALSNKITDKLRSFGAEVIFPGYYGMVPLNFKEKFPQSNPLNQGKWVSAIDRPWLILNDDSMFDRVSDLFYEKTKEHFGECFYFSGDPFHEGGKTDGVDLSEFGKCIVDKMKSYNPDGVWLFQGWQENPKPDLLKKIKKSDMLIASLSADTNYKSENGFGMRPWIYCTTPNFGGVRKMYGNIRGMLTEPFEYIKNSSSIAPVGIGMTMEGIEVDEILYEVFSSIAFKESEPSVEEFLEKFLMCRYKRADKIYMEAYKILCDKIYTLSGTNLFGTKESALCARPGLDIKNVSTWGNVEDTPYEEDVLIKVARLLLKNYSELCRIDGYRLDLTDILRQAVSDKSWKILSDIKDAFEKKDRTRFDTSSEKFLMLFELQENLLKTNEKTMLGRWLKKAEDYAETEQEKIMYVFNAKNLITLWASKEGSIELRDYAHREWSGMMKGFYKKRWSAFLCLMSMYFERQEEMPEIKWTDYDMVFALENERYPVTPEGDLYEAAKDILNFLES